MFLCLNAICNGIQVFDIRGFTNLTNLQKFVKEFISIVRKEKSVSELVINLFSSPCQTTVIYTKKEYLMTMLVKHDPEGADKEVDAHTIDKQKEIFDFVDKKVLANPYWFKKGHVVEVAGVLGRLIRRKPSRLMKTPIVLEHGIIGYRKRSDSKDGFFQCTVNLKTNKPEDLLRHLIEQDNMRVKGMKARAIEKITYLFCSVWYPPFVFDDEAITLKPKFVIDVTYKGNRVLFNNHSFICVISPIEPPLAPFRDKAVDCFNEIIGTAGLLGIEGCTVTPDDTQIFQFTEKLGTQIGYSLPRTPTVRSFISEDFLRDPVNVYQFERFCPFRKYKKSVMLDVVGKAEKITQDKDIKNYIISYLDAKTHFLIEQFKTSFLLTWIVLEKHIDELWLRTLISRNVSGRRLGKLSKSMLWTVDDKLETLNLLDQISNERYFEIIRLKKIRNAIVHKGRAVTKQETEECLRFSLDIVKEIVRDKCLIEL